jgi:hypothetical protein
MKRESFFLHLLPTDFSDHIYKVEESRFDDLMQAAEEVELRHALWNGLKELEDRSVTWTATHFESLDTVEVEEIVNK